MNSNSMSAHADSETSYTHSPSISAASESNPTFKHPTELPPHPTEPASTQAGSKASYTHSQSISAASEGNPTFEHPTEPPPHPTKPALHSTKLAQRDQDLQFPTYDAAEAYLWELALENVHGISKRRSMNPFIDSNGAKRYRRIQFQCKRSGDPAEDKKRHARRQSPKKPGDLRASTRCGCPWQAICCFSRATQRWDIAISENAHNHKPSQRPELSNAYRRFTRVNEEKTTGQSFFQKVANLKDAGLTIGNIAASLSTPQVPILYEDVKSAVRALRQSTYRRYSATQLFLRKLRDLEETGNVFLRVEHHSQTEGIHRIFWTYKDSIELFKKNPELLSFDNT